MACTSSVIWYAMCGAEPNTYCRERVVCNICGPTEELFLFYAPERIVQCAQCGLIYVNPRLDASSLKKIYTKEYFVADLSRTGVDYKAYADYIADEGTILRSMDLRMRRVEQYSAGRGRVLDVGCATGFSLIAAHRRHWEAEGIEISDFCADYAASRGLKVHHGTLIDYPRPHHAFEAITMWDYLEHAADPVRELRICRELLKPGGVVLVSFPNVDSWSFRLLRNKWIGFKNIEHFYFYSRKTLAKAAARAGLKLEHTFYQGKYVALSFFLSRVQYYAGWRPLLAVISKVANAPFARNISFYLNPYDILNAVLRKPE